MPIPEIEEFAKILIENVRDAAIRNADRRVSKDAKDPVAKRWKEAAKNGNLEAITAMVAPDIVDNVIFLLLRAIDQELLPLSVTSSNGKKINLIEDGLGELGGEYMASPGWRAKYSKERFVDDLSDLNLSDVL